MTDPRPQADPAGMPRWVKRSGLALVVFVLLVVVALLSGHGPWRHLAGAMLMAQASPGPAVP